MTKNLFLFLFSLSLNFTQVFGQNISTIALTGYNAKQKNWNSVRDALGGEVDLAVDDSGNIYFADCLNSQIKKISQTTGQIKVIAGTGDMGFYGDGGLAVNAALNRPFSLALDKKGNIYISDYVNFRIRKVDKSTGIISTIAGDGLGRYYGDGGPAISASLHYPLGITLDDSDNIYIADGYNSVIRKITAKTGIITTVVGKSPGGFSGDNGLATNAQIWPGDVAVDKNGNIYIADRGNNRIRFVNKTTGIINTILGGATKGYGGDSVLSSTSLLARPCYIDIDDSENIYISDRDNNRIRKYNKKSDLLIKIAGKDSIPGFAGDGFPSSNAVLNYPTGIAVDKMSGNVYFTDNNNSRIRVISNQPKAPIVQSPQIYCQYETAIPFEVSGSNLKWYTTPIGGVGSSTTPIANTTLSDTTVYFVSQKNSDTESLRSAIVVIVKPSPSVPVINSPLDYCLGDSTQLLIASSDSGSIVSWFGDSLKTITLSQIKPITTQKGSSSFYFLSTNSLGCKSDLRKFTVNILHPDLPEFKSPINLCFGKKADLLEAKGTNIRWYTNLSSDTGSITAPILQTNAFQDRTFYITQTDSFGCTSDTGIINVYVHPTPQKPFVQNQFQYCINEKAEALYGVGIDLKWYNVDSSIVSKTAPTPDTRNQGNQFYYATQTNTLGCESDKAMIEIKVHPKPKINIEEKISKPYTGLPIELNCTSDIGKTYIWNTGDNGTKAFFTPKNEGRYYFWVQSSSEFGCKSDTSWHYVDILPSEYWNSDFEVHPNPFKNNIRLTNVNLQDIISVNLYNLNGMKVFQSELPLKSLELYIPDNLGSGYYLLEINTVGHAHPTRLLYKE